MMTSRPQWIVAIALAVSGVAVARLPKGQSNDPMAALTGPAAAPAADDPAVVLRRVANGMDDIHSALTDRRTDTPVQEKQKAVTASLDSMIAALEKQCSGNGGGGSLNPTKGMARSTLAGGPGGINDLHDPKASEKQWGQLKPKEREQILQSKTDGFPAGYEALLQSYYRRLANEDNAAAKPAAPSEPAAPAPAAATPAAPGPAKP